MDHKVAVNELGLRLLLVWFCSNGLFSLEVENLGISDKFISGVEWNLTQDKCVCDSTQSI